MNGIPGFETLSDLLTSSDNAISMPKGGKASRTELREKALSLLLGFLKKDELTVADLKTIEVLFTIYNTVKDD